MSNLPVIIGGMPIFTPNSFYPYRTLGEEERRAAMDVMVSGQLSMFKADWTDEFYGGKYVQRLERDWEQYFSVPHAVSFNTATTAILSALCAIGVGPGDHVVVPSMTMSATAAGVMFLKAWPIFADVSPDNYCLDATKVEKLITPKTKAIIGVDLYGDNCDWDALRAIAKKYGLFLIEDSAQSIGSLYRGRHSGTLGDIGIYSLNRHKHIQCGEGGIAVTSHKRLASRLQLVRNHGEIIVDKRESKIDQDIVGLNFRMTEMEAAIAIEQLKKLEGLVQKRILVAEKMAEIFSRFPGITAPVFQRTEGDRHVYYSVCFRLNSEQAGMSRQTLVSALRAEGAPIFEGGIKPLHYQPLYHQPSIDPDKPSYEKGICPVAEKLWSEELFHFKMETHSMALNEVDKFVPVLERIFNYKKAILGKAETIQWSQPQL